MYCRKCGNELKEDDIFCNKCGTKVINVNTQNQKQSKSYSSEYYIKELNIDNEKIDSSKLMSEYNANDIFYERLKNITNLEEEQCKNLAEELQKYYIYNDDNIYDTLRKIEYKYEEIYKKIEREFDINQFKEEPDDDVYMIETGTMKNSDVERVEACIEKRKIFELKQKIEEHNAVVNKIIEISNNIEFYINQMNENYRQRIKEQNRQRIKIISPLFIIITIVYIIAVIFLWDSFGAWSLLVAPLIWILAVANDGFRNVEGRRIYGDKWDKMTNYEQETQMKKDQIIHDISNRK